MYVYIYVCVLFKKYSCIYIYALHDFVYVLYNDIDYHVYKNIYIYAVMLCLYTDLFVYSYPEPFFDPSFDCKF